MADTIAGFVGGVVSIYVGLPLDTIKVRLQTKGFLFQSSVDCAYKTVRNEGLLALWKGAYPAVCTGIVENAVVFSANGLLHSMFCEAGETPTFFKLCALNGASAVFSGFAITPSEVIKCRLQTCLDYGQSSMIMPVIRDIWHRDGIHGFFRGLMATWLRDIPFYMVFFGSYTYYKRFMLQTWYSTHTNMSTDALPSWNYVIGGGLAGSAGWLTIFPFDNIKSRQQASSKKLSFIETGKHIIKTGGVRKLYKGCYPCVLRGFPANGALFLTVEYVKQVFEWMGMDGGSSLGSHRAQQDQA
mmetsp:Transcript_10629/g.15957  ORF Transcript_10629/g.15957 Transcript_10629/m.15957 type:complete len:299 (-) Transcript_10629:345-1241(-)|eukprot:CAMPEP_0202689640 /NCGR_PEP_ID=MMETSP1385-20130828/4848_1 /ASSEMBLY_ACC=CAM_ASM_000861 /TAXON_ID=933848 /ORGANISM="Elphidium margaritaceum" /LENGTH=298 /DNA_ID=CAMNT_0049344793 /DNA_START=154 /DNA_END=1050 /DNA_ORIENTATION=+